MESGSGTADVGADGRPRRWPYSIGFAFLALAAVAFLYAPFGGIVYVALPGMVVATWFGFVDRVRGRVGLLVSLAAFLVGLLTGLIGLTLAAAGTATGSFASQESGFLVGAAALWLLPLLGLLSGGVGLAFAWSRPGSPRGTASEEPSS